MASKCKSGMQGGWGGGWAVADRAFTLTSGDCVNSLSKGPGEDQGARSNVHDCSPVSWFFTCLSNCPISSRTMLKASGKWRPNGAFSARVCESS